MALPLSQLPREAIREVRSRKWLAFFLFAAVSMAVLAVGYLWPYKYQSSVVIFVDDQNIIRPLMEGSAVTTKINERASAAKELLWSRNVIEKIARDPDIYGEGTSDIGPAELEGRIAGLRGNLIVRPRGDSYFSIEYTDNSQLRAFKIAQRLGQLFIEENNERKRAESRAAYEFIDKQVKSYEQQLAQVERNLKDFLSENVDGTESEANSRMADLRRQLELATLEREELETRAASLQQQLNSLAPSLTQKKTEDSFQQRINALQARLDTLRLQYHDSYPDIVILQEQLTELKNQRRQALANSASEDTAVEGESVANPVYQEVRSELVTTRADAQTIQTRIRSIERLIQEQAKRMERIQGNKAQYSELTRDMEVNKQIYDDLLKRREKARVSMHLDIEGQGLNYRINETAQYPLSPDGPRFELFAIAGLLIGIAAPFGAAVGWAQVDPRIRVREQIEEVFEFPVLEQLPEVRTPYEKRKDRKVTAVIIVFSLIVVAVYLGFAGATVFGVN